MKDARPNQRALAITVASALLVVGSAACGDRGEGEDSTQESAAEAPTSRGLAWPEQGLPKVHDAWPSYTILGRRQRPERITWRLAPAGAVVPLETWRVAVKAAFAAWQSTGVVSFEEVTPPMKADVVLSWHGKNGACRFIAWHGGIAHAGRVGFDGAVIHFNTEADWSKHSLKGAALHEIGHVLGLGHSPRGDALMYGGYDDTHDALRPPDLAALHTLYGGGRSHEDDLFVVRFGKDGGIESTTATIRAIAPESSRMTLLDTDGDEIDELLLWRTTKSHEPLFVFEFMAGGVVAKTRGPFKGFTRPDRTTFVGREAKVGPLVLHVRDDARYVARRFDDNGLPSIPFSGAELDLDVGLFDRDGDGTLDSTQPVMPGFDGGRTLLGYADVDGDGFRDHLVREGDRGARWVMTGGRESGREPGPVFDAPRVVVGQIDSNPRVDAVIRR